MGQDWVMLRARPTGLFWGTVSHALLNDVGHWATHWRRGWASGIPPLTLNICPLRDRVVREGASHRSLPVPLVSVGPLGAPQIVRQSPVSADLGARPFSSASCVGALLPLPAMRYYILDAFHAP